VGVLISLPDEDYERRRSFYDSTRIAHAVEYIFDTAEELNLPVSINISLGTNGHAHDASSAVSRWCDSALAVPGRSICIAAGNAGQEAPEAEGDYGFIMGRIHTSGRINARGLENDIEWSVVGNTIQDVSENELEIWYSPADRFAVSIRPPGHAWIGPIEPGQFIENRQLSDGTFFSVYNELYHPANGANYIAIYLSPYFGQNMVKGVSAGIWTVRLHGHEIRDGRYHGWIERDDPHPVGQIGLQEYWQFPSFFTENSNVDDSSISSMACGHRIVSVGNLDVEKEKISITSSQGPTRDGRFKPDVSAPGTGIVAANGFEPDDNNTWISMSGTSMASPHVAGIVGLMLEKEPNLTAAQIGGIIQRTARPLPGADYTWRNDAGFGVIDHIACLEEAETINQREDLT
jgi:subtilisin family serine protease